MTIKPKILRELCNVCGVSVRLGSGYFVNRVPDLNSPRERKRMGRAYPTGDFVCSVCDERSEWAEDGYMDVIKVTDL